MTASPVRVRAASLALAVTVAAAMVAACGSSIASPTPATSGLPATSPDAECPGGPSAGTPGTYGGTELPEIVPTPKTVRYGEMVAMAELVCLSCPLGNLRDRLREVATEAGVAVGFEPVCDRPHSHLTIALDATDLPPQGYRLEISQGDHGPVVEIDAGDEAGAFYGMLSLGQLMADDGGTTYVRLAEVEDHPTFERRGVILDTEQRPSAADREKQLERLRFGVRYKLNFLAHPNATPDHSQPGAELIAYCDSHYVELISLVGYRDWLSVAPIADIKAYLKSQYDLGVRSFSLDWDDMPIDDPPVVAADHATVFAELYAYLRSLDPEIKVAITMPPYGGVPSVNLRTGPAGETYLGLMREKLPDDVLVFWTGNGGVFSPIVTVTGAQAYATLVGHRVGLWDNDAIGFANERRPLSGRAADLATVISTYMGNLAGEALWRGTDGHFALLTTLLYTWSPEIYDPATAGEIAERLVR